MSELCKQMALLGKGLGNENRFTILQTIMKKSRTVGEIASLCQLPQPAVSQHLKVLRSANLVESTRQGKEVLYLVNAAFMTTLLKKLTTNLS
ncbi:MAG TPA: metalloregulator ArsR/SmtB family transcription factor [Candidatus Paceibacterota bacterium]